MQDKTIDNALQALRKRGGHQGKLAEVLLDMRGVAPRLYRETTPLKRGGTKRLILGALNSGPKTTGQIGDLIRGLRPDITPRSAANRAHQGLLRLEVKGLVCRDGRRWMLAH
ncbi:hypothetical protein [Histidinibacterium lentulum]|uniref:hypothetical protein n=1 Tax=Histidinibacterium lentulum TaxID=2480588 RepID=UPI000F4CB495|nr:hypothetical protein [Histidinibacterium lentulum]